MKSVKKIKDKYTSERREMKKNTFVSSDQHLGHRNILKFCADTRPFDTIEEHDEQLIIRHNSVVKHDDEMYFIGDFAFCSADKILRILKRLNGTKYFLFGNHDKQMRQAAEGSAIKEQFVWMKDYHELKVDRADVRCPIVLHHYPIYSWNRMHHGALHFYGHTHSGIPTMFAGRGKDIGVDSNNCYPWNVDDLVELMNKCDVVDARERQEKQ